MLVKIKCFGSEFWKQIMNRSLIKKNNLLILFIDTRASFRLPLNCYLSLSPALSLPILLLSPLWKGTPQCRRPFLSPPAKLLLTRQFKKFKSMKELSCFNACFAGENISFDQCYCCFASREEWSNSCMLSLCRSSNCGCACNTELSPRFLEINFRSLRIEWLRLVNDRSWSEALITLIRITLDQHEQGLITPDGRLIESYLD